MSCKFVAYFSNISGRRKNKIKFYGGTYGIEEGSRQFYIEVMEGYVKFWWQATPNIFDSSMFRAVRGVRGAILDILNKSNRADFVLNSHKVKLPIRAHVKLKKSILGAESKLRGIFSTDFISLHQKLWTKLIGPFFYPSLSRFLKRCVVYLKATSLNECNK